MQISNCHNRECINNASTVRDKNGCNSIMEESFLNEADSLIIHKGFESGNFLYYWSITINRE